MAVEKDVLKELLSTLAETLPMTVLLNTLNSKNLIGDSEKAEIEAKTTDERKATYFLDNMIKCLKLDDTKIFYSFLKVLETSDNGQANAAGNKIRTKLNEAMSSTQGSADKPQEFRSESYSGPNAGPVAGTEQPAFSTEPWGGRRGVGSTFKLSYSVSSKTPVTFSYSFNDGNVSKPLSHGGRISIESNNENTESVLTIKNAELTDAGHYSCTATNAGGTVTVRTRIDVLSLRYSEKDLVDLSKEAVDKFLETEILPGEKDKIRRNISLVLMVVNRYEFQATVSYLCKGKILGCLDYSNPPRTYYIGYWGKFLTALIQQDDQGPDYAAEATRSSIDTFPNLQYIVSVGVCGTFKELGDVIVAKKIVGYDKKKAKDDKMISRDDSFSAGRELRHWMKRERGWTFHINLDPNKQAKVDYGCVLSGSTLCARAAYRDELKEDFCPEAIGLEMEGIGIFNALKEKQTNVQAVVVKAGCDHADGSKDKTWQPVSALAAADFVYHQLKDVAISQDTTSAAGTQPSTSQTSANTGPAAETGGKQSFITESFNATDKESAAVTGGTSTGSQTPSLVDLQELISKVSDVWYSLGLILFERSDESEVTSVNDSGLSTNKARCQEMFKVWVTKRYCSWQRLIDALDNDTVHKYELAKVLRRKYSG